jgi:hypothetical protein
MLSLRPHPALRNRVVGIDVVETDGGASLVLPSTSVVLGVQFRGRVRTSDGYLALAGVTGIQRTVKTYSYDAQTGSLLVRLTPEGAACLGVPVAQLTGRSVALDAFLPRALVVEAQERLDEAGDTAARVAVVERLLMALPYASVPLVTRAVALLADAHDEASVSAIASAVGFSERQLERRFLARRHAEALRHAAPVRARGGAGDDRAIVDGCRARRRLLRPITFHSRFSALYWLVAKGAFRTLSVTDVGFVQLRPLPDAHARGMTTSAQPDLFTNVHKGIRCALFAACAKLGRADGESARELAARAALAEAMHFVAHHGENEDLLLLPLLRERAPEIFARMNRAHAALDEARGALTVYQPTASLYLVACAFTSQYLAHMDEEERQFEPAIRAVLSAEEATAFGRRSVERTAPAEQRMMLGWMLPAMTRLDADAFLGRLPPAFAAELSVLVDPSSATRPTPMPALTISSCRQA